MDDPLVKLEDQHGLEYCNKGARAFAKRHGLDYARFRREGLPASVLEATGDAMALKLVRMVRDGG